MYDVNTNNNVANFWPFFH